VVALDRLVVQISREGPMRNLAYLATSAVFLAHAAGAAVYDEAVNGDLSGNRVVPTGLGALTSAVSSILGTSVGGAFDYLTFTVPAGAKRGGQLRQPVKGSGFGSLRHS